MGRFDPVTANGLLAWLCLSATVPSMLSLPTGAFAGALLVLKNFISDVRKISMCGSALRYPLNFRSVARETLGGSLETRVWCLHQS